MKKLFLLLCIPSIAFASPYRSKIDYVYIENPYMRKIEVTRAVRGAIQDINTDGVLKIGIGKRTEAGDPFKSKRSFIGDIGFYYFNTFFVSYSSWYYKNYALKPKRELIVMDPPIEVNGVNYIAGYAWLGGAFTKPIAYCNAMAVNDKGESRHRHVEQCIRHEVYHLFCATHDNLNANIMHPNAMGEFSDQIKMGNGAKLPLNDKARNQILKCVETKAARYRR